jgi:3-hydroxyacyl-[acyl-carrier-protein] dehydratase
MPGALLIESLAQAGTALLEYSSNFEKKAILVMVDQAKFRKIVKPGTLLTIYVNIVTGDGSSAQMDGEIKNGDVVVMTARMTFTLKDADQFYPKKVRNLMTTIYDVWFEAAEIKTDRGSK